MKKARILFLGGFSVGKDGTEGGQIFACRSLVSSPISDFVEWKLVDSTQRSLPPPGVLIRAYDAFSRLCQCVYHLIFSRIDTVLVFTNFSVFSIAEKGLVCILGGLLRKHVVVSFRFHPHLPKRGQRFYKAYVRLVCRSCRKIICQSQLAADELIRLFKVSAQKIEVVHNWIDVRRFAAGESDGHMQSPPAAVGDKIKLIYVGWMHPKKGVQFLIPAIRLLADKRQDFLLTMCGGGDLFESLKQQTMELGIQDFVDFRGWVKNEEVHALLNESSIFVLPSLAEGMPNSLLQAMSCGLPVITTNVSSIPAIITNNVNGFLIEPGSPDAICQAIDKLISAPDLRRRMSATNREQILKHDIRNVWPRVAKILNVTVG